MMTVDYNGYGVFSYKCCNCLKFVYGGDTGADIISLINTTNMQYEGVHKEKYSIEQHLDLSETSSVTSQLKRINYFYINIHRGL